MEIDSPYPIPFELSVFVQMATIDPVHRALPLVGEGVCCEVALCGVDSPVSHLTRC